MIRTRTGCVLAATFAIILAATPAWAELGPITGSGIDRIGGADRYEVSANVSAAIATPPQEEVFIGSGEVFPDALAAGPVAYAGRAPMLLTHKDEIPQSVLDELLRLAPTRITVVGGPNTVSEDVVSQLGAATGAEVERVAGADRYEVAATLATRMAPEGAATVYLVSGLVFSDALSAGPAAALDGAPVLLSSTNHLPDATAAALTALHPAKVIVVGGPATVSSDVTAAVKELVPGVDVDRYYGADRYEAAAALVAAKWRSGSESVFYASGTKFPDALSGTPAAGINAAPLLLTGADCHPFATTKAGEALDPSLRVVLGGDLSAYGGSSSCGPKPTYPFPADLDCKDFSSQDAAQDWFDYWEPKVGDIYRLDRDDDGKVCEIWPPR